jgi:hypothetical protein
MTMYKGIRLHNHALGIYAEIPDAHFPGEVITVAGPAQWVRKMIDWYLSDEYRDLEAQL